MNMPTKLGTRLNLTIASSNFYIASNLHMISRSRTCLQRRFRRETGAEAISGSYPSGRVGAGTSASGSMSSHPTLAEFQASQERIPTSVDLHVPRLATQRSKARVEEAIERLHEAKEDVAFDEANEGLRIALNKHQRVAECGRRCEEVKKMFERKDKDGDGVGI